MQSGARPRNVTLQSEFLSYSDEVGNDSLGLCLAQDRAGRECRRGIEDPFLLVRGVAGAKGDPEWGWFR